MIFLICPSCELALVYPSLDVLLLTLVVGLSFSCSVEFLSLSEDVVDTLVELMDHSRHEAILIIPLEVLAGFIAYASLFSFSFYLLVVD